MATAKPTPDQERAAVNLQEIGSGYTAERLDQAKEDWKFRWAKYEALAQSLALAPDSPEKDRALNIKQETYHSLLRERVDLNEMITRYNAVVMEAWASDTWTQLLNAFSFGVFGNAPKQVSTLNSLGIIQVAPAILIVGVLLVVCIAFETAKVIWGNENIKSKGLLDTLSDAVNAVPQVIKVIPDTIEHIPDILKQSGDFLKVAAVVGALGFVGYLAFKRWGGAKS
jgi:hypothetical protein